VSEPVHVPPEPPVTRTALKEGASLFQTHCVVCHGKNGKGDGPLAGKINDTWGHPIQPANFHLPAGIKGGVKLGHDSRHIFITIMTGVGGDPMPAFQQQLNEQEVWKVTHYVQSLRIRSQEDSLLAFGLDPDQLSESRKNLWGNLSKAAMGGKIDQDILNE
jgi:cytochrome c oxidase cbb3-type subunit I/II